jgi:excisionase family DNA binding protein
MNTPETITTKEASQLLTVSATTLRNWEAAEKIRAVRVNGQRRYYKDDIYEILSPGHTKRASIDTPLTIEGVLDHPLKLVDIGDIDEYPYDHPYLKATPIIKPIQRLTELKDDGNGVAYTTYFPLRDGYECSSGKVAVSEDTIKVSFYRIHDLVTEITIEDCEGSNIPYSMTIDKVELDQNTRFITPLTTVALPYSFMNITLSASYLDSSPIFMKMRCVALRALDRVMICESKVNRFIVENTGERRIYSITHGVIE